MERFHSLQILRVEPDAEQSVIIEFAIPSELATEFNFVQGQYITLRKEIGGRLLRRCYSIWCGAHEKRLSIGVKAVKGGEFSTFLTSHLRAGDRLDVSAPAGRFHTSLAPEERREYAGFAAGSGITPILSNVSTILATEPKSTFNLCYSNRTRASRMFSAEIDRLRSAFQERLRVIEFFSREEAPCARSGRLDAKQCRRLFATEIDARKLHALFVCGPAEMIADCREEATTAGLAASRIHCELFAAPEEPSSSSTGGRPQVEADVLFVISGATTEVHASADCANLLEAGLDAGLDLPHSCCRGICDTCRARVAEGDVGMRTNHVLTDDEIGRGYVLACQAYPLSGTKIVIDFDDLPS